MKVYIKKISNNKLKLKKDQVVYCDRCYTKVTWNALIDYEDEWGFYIKEEEHYYCVDYLLELAQSKIKNEKIDI